MLRQLSKRSISFNGKLIPFGCRSMTSKNPFGIKKPYGNRTIDLINQDHKLNDYSKKVFSNMGKFLAVSAISSGLTVATSTSLINNGLDVQNMLMPLGIGWISAMGGSLYCAYKLDTLKDDPVARIKYAYMMHGLLGVTITPSLLMFPQVIPQALVIATSLVAGPVAMALMTPPDKFLSWGVPLATGLCGLIGIGFSSIGLHMIGFSELAMNLHTVDLYGGLILFTAYSAYDTHKMISDFNKGSKDAVGHACNYTLNFINLFIRLLEILSNKKK